jgi:hypothetical protein
MLITVITLSIIVLLLIYIAWNLLIKNEKLTDVILKQEQVLEASLEKFNIALDKMKTIDSKGGFESEDEVGQIFQGIKDIIYDLESELEIKE